jgi:hypothetical protein
MPGPPTCESGAFNALFRRSTGRGSQPVSLAIPRCVRKIKVEIHLRRHIRLDVAQEGETLLVAPGGTTAIISLTTHAAKLSDLLDR